MTVQGSRTPASTMSGGALLEAMRAHEITPEALSQLTCRSVRTIKSYIYGERAIPQDVAMAVGSMTGAHRVAAGPWWESALQRIGSTIESELYRERRELRSAVLAMCRSCEPEGICRQADCPLRSVSPLPVAIRRKSA